MIQYVLIFIFFLCSSYGFTKSNETTFQILHTNDLHSFFEGTRSGKGGYARLKTKIDQLVEKNWVLPTFILDAGDFGEGSSFYLTDEGKNAFRLLDLLGIEVTVLGNHDYMQGLGELEKQLESTKLKAQILSANLKGPQTLLKAHTTLKKGDVTLDIIGLSTPELHFKYPLEKGLRFTSPIKALKIWEKQLPLLRPRRLRVALTHLGLEVDKKLAQASEHLDLIIGGHSHTRLTGPVYIKNKKGRLIPIVQTGAHGVALGQLLITLRPQGTKVSYELHDITSELAENPEVKSVTQTARSQRESYFQGALGKVIGETKIPLTGYVDGTNAAQISCWGQHVAKLTQELGSAEVGLYLADFSGEEIAPGKLTFGDLVDQFPHFRRFGDKGWSVATMDIDGQALRLLLKYALKHPETNGFNFWGVTMPATPEEARTWNHKQPLMIGGKKLNPYKLYRLALPSEALLGLQKALPVLQGLVYTRPRYLSKFYWEELESYIANNSPLTCL